VSEFVLGDDFARALTETTQALVCVLDSGGRILLFNDACERSTGSIWDAARIPLSSTSDAPRARSCVT